MLIWNVIIATAQRVDDTAPLFAVQSFLTSPWKLFFLSRMYILARGITFPPQQLAEEN